MNSRTAVWSSALAACLAAGSQNIAAQDLTRTSHDREHDPSPITSAPAPNDSVSVRVYGLHERDVRTVVESASQILRAANIRTEWPRCRTTCSQPPEPGNLIVRLVRGHTSADARGRWSLGFSLIDPILRAGTLATIYLDRVTWIAAHARVDRRIVLGRAVAHEIGHLLLGTAEHATEGLMRADWTRHVLERNDPADWRFTAPETVALHDALDRRESMTQARRHAASVFNLQSGDRLPD